MYIPKDINKCLKQEAKLAGRTNMEGLVVAPAWSELFLQADYVIAKQADEIERLREDLMKVALVHTNMYIVEPEKMLAYCVAIADTALKRLSDGYC